MDKLADILKRDAAEIRADVSAELDDRIRASLESVSQDKPPLPVRPARWSMWWASSLTGITALATIILIINVNQPEKRPTVETTMISVPPPYPLDLNAEAAVLTAPLVEELEKLEADIRRAQQRVSAEIGLSM
jgi:hypothetical protein